jgi:hypothetical protein
VYSLLVEGFAESATLDLQMCAHVVSELSVSSGGPIWSFW